MSKKLIGEDTRFEEYAHKTVRSDVKTDQIDLDLREAQNEGEHKVFTQLKIHAVDIIRLKWSEDFVKKVLKDAVYEHAKQMGLKIDDSIMTFDFKKWKNGDWTVWAMLKSPFGEISKNKFSDTIAGVNDLLINAANNK